MTDYTKLEQAVDAVADTIWDVASNVWEFAELGYKEFKSLAYIAETLEKNGFAISSRGIGGLGTSWVATWGWVALSLVLVSPFSAKAATESSESGFSSESGLSPKSDKLKAPKVKFLEMSETVLGQSSLTYENNPASPILDAVNTVGETAHETSDFPTSTQAADLTAQVTDGNHVMPWRFSIEPFLDVPVGDNGNIAADGVEAPVDAGSGDFLNVAANDLAFAPLGRLEIWNGSGGTIVSGDYVNLGTGEITIVDVPSDIQQDELTPEVTSELEPSENTFSDVEGVDAVIDSSAIAASDQESLSGVLHDVSFQAQDLLNDSSPNPEHLTVGIRSVEIFEAPTEGRFIAQAESDETECETTQADPEASSDQQELAKSSQNPIASLISVPFQNNTNFGVGEFNRTSNILNIQPVVPAALGDELTLVNRLIVPVAYQPELARIPLPNGETVSIGNEFGLGDIVYQGVFVPTPSGNLTWGVGPLLLFPSATATPLGTGKWGAGAAAVAVLSDGPILAGALVTNTWSFAGDRDRSDVSVMNIQPFFNYNFDGGWYAHIGSGQGVTANWFGEDGEKWLVPIGGGGGRVFNIGNQPVNMTLRAFWNAVKPENAADWTLQFSFTLLFPE